MKEVNEIDPSNADGLDISRLAVAGMSESLWAGNLGPMVDLVEELGNRGIDLGYADKHQAEDEAIMAISGGYYIPAMGDYPELHETH